MALTGNEVAAANQQRRAEELPKSQVGNLIESGVSLAAPAVALGSSLVATGAPGLTIAGSIVAGLGIVDWFRKLGTSKVNENLETLGQATEDALNRVENVLKTHGTAIDDIRRRLDSEALRNAMASASLQALRTTQKERLKRLALVLANGVKDDDLALESTDDMMRAAVELKDVDVQLLKKLYESQAGLLQSHSTLSSEWSQQIALGWSNSFSFLDSPDWKGSRSSLARLQANGLIQEVRTMMTPTGRLANQPFGLLPDGKKFYERLQEIAV